MDYKKQIKDVIDRFYVDCIEEFKEAELRIANDSKFRSMFRKKDYSGNIEFLRNCKKQTRNIRFPMGDIPKDDDATKELVRHTEKCVRQFNKLCDAYIQMQVSLKKKAEGESVTYREYMKVYNQTQEHRVAMNKELAELDLLYTDFIDEMDYDVYEFL